MADVASHDEHFARLTALCGAVRDYLAKGAASKGSAPDPMAHVALQEGALLLLELKEVNRSVWEAVGRHKEEAKEANQSLDSADLLLQNLQYEKNHFLREIRHCRDFHGELAVDLVDKAAFARTAPAELRAADEASDPHQYHVNRLEHELRQRQARGRCSPSPPTLRRLSLAGGGSKTRKNRRFLVRARGSSSRRRNLSPPPRQHSRSPTRQPRRTDRWAPPATRN